MEQHPSLGFYIWAGVKPTVKMGLTMLAGFVLSKKGMFPPAASKGLSQLTMNVAIPCLLFSSIVPSLDQDTIQNFGPLFMLAIVYMAIGLGFGFIIRELFYIPDDFYYGILITGLTSNWGNLSNAIVQAVSQTYPFNGDLDLDLGIAYSSIFVLVAQTMFYGLGVYKICGWDFQDSRRKTRPATARARLQHRKLQLQCLFRRRGSRQSLRDFSSDPRNYTEDMGDKTDSIEVGNVSPTATTAPLPLVLQSAPSTADGQTASLASTRTTIPRRILSFARSLVNPLTITIATAILIALVKPLKALIIHVPGFTSIPDAPDGQPPLSFIYQTADFIGALGIPAALILVGASFARLKIPRPISKLPLAAIGAMVLAKFVLRPAVAIPFVIGLRNGTSMFPKDQKMLSFIAFLLSGTTSSNQQMAATMLFVPETHGSGSPDTLAAFLLGQYLFLLISSCAQTALSLYLVAP